MNTLRSKLKKPFRRKIMTMTPHEVKRAVKYIELLGLRVYGANEDQRGDKMVRYGGCRDYGAKEVCSLRKFLLNHGPVYDVIDGNLLDDPPVKRGRPRRSNGN